MTDSQAFIHQVIDQKGVVSGALAYFRDGSTPGTIFVDKECRRPATNPLKADSLGNMTAYIRNGDEFEITIRRPDGTFVRQFSSTGLPSGLGPNDLQREASEANKAGLVEHYKDWLEERRAHVAEIVKRPEPEVIVKEVDRPETLQRITNLERAIQEQRARAEAAESKLAQAQYQEPEGDFKFKVPFLQTERKVNEDLTDADRRLFEEYSNLELRRPLEPADDSRWRSLQAGLFDFKG